MLHRFFLCQLQNSETANLRCKFSDRVLVSGQITNHSENRDLTVGFSTSVPLVVASSYYYYYWSLKVTYVARLGAGAS